MPEPINRHQIRRFMEAGAQIVEVLPATEYEKDHLPGAISLPLRTLEGEARRLLDPNRPIVVYCWDSA